MSNQRYPEEFKIEAVRQVTERGHSVAEVSSRLGTILYQKAIEGDMRAIQFYLKTQAGWSEKSSLELTSTYEEDRTWTIEIVQPDGLASNM